MHLVDQIKEKAKKSLQTVVLPESYDERMLLRPRRSSRRGWLRIVILGDPADDLRPKPRPRGST